LRFFFLSLSLSLSLHSTIQVVKKGYARLVDTAYRQSGERRNDASNEEINVRAGQSGTRPIARVPQSKIARVPQSKIARVPQSKLA